VCHTTPNLKDPLPRDCAGCHRKADPHAGRFGEACEKCHGSNAWKPATFDHTRDGRFELVGRHARLDCHACHTAVVSQQKLGTDCLSCHRTNDVHAGKLGRDCAHCHGVEKWRTDVAFDHDLTDFPLVGLHVAAPCVACHASASYKGAAVDCHGCHQREDKHKGALGKDCESCHSPNGWGLWEFDHAKATGFALVGAHARATCEGCHKQPPEVVKLAGDCASCHMQDDVHLGQFGRQCQRCHGSVTFKGARMQ
jgi:Zn finger protein HypA/HybF involved in hydrogenase expression